MQGFVLLHFSIYLSLSTSEFIFMVIVLIDTCNTYITKEGLTLPQVLHWLGYEFLNHCEGSINCSWKYRLILSYVTVMKGKLSRFDFWYMGDIYESMMGLNHVFFLEGLNHVFTFWVFSHTNETDWIEHDNSKTGEI